MKKLLAVFVVVLCVFAPFAPNAFALDLSADDAISRIMNQSQDLKKADANIKMADAQLDAVNANRWFHIDANAMYMNLINVQNPNGHYTFDVPQTILPYIQQAAGQFNIDPNNIPTSVELPDNYLVAGATITQPIYTFGKIGNAADAARTAISMAKSGQEQAQREVHAAAAQIYWTAKMADDAMAVATRDLEESMRAKTALESAGRANRMNLLKISADVAAKQVSLSDAEFNRDSAVRLLRTMAGIDPDEPINLTDDFPDNFDTLSVPDTLKSNPEWDRLAANARVYEAQAKSKRADRYPTLAAMAGYDFDMMHTDWHMDRGIKNQSAYWGLSLTIPIWDGGAARANATIAAANADAAYQDLDKSKRTKSNDYIDAVAKYAHLRGDLDGLNNALDLARRAAKMSADRFAAGQTSATELSDVQASLAQMDMAVLQTKYNLVMARENVYKLLGNDKK